MKTKITFALLAALALNLTACSTPQERARRRAERQRERARDDARWAAERRERDRELARRDRERDEEDFQLFLFRFARELGKTPSELTSTQRADARREFNYRYARHRY